MGLGAHSLPTWQRSCSISSLDTWQRRALNRALAVDEAGILVHRSYLISTATAEG